MIPTAQPIPQYEVYPRTPPQAFKSQILSKQILLEGFCMRERIDPRLLPELVDAVLIDWELSEEKHPDYTTAAKHMLNHIRIKYKANAQRNNQSRPLRQFASTNKDADERLADFAKELLRQSSGHNQP